MPHLHRWNYRAENRLVKVNDISYFYNSQQISTWMFTVIGVSRSLSSKIDICFLFQWAKHKKIQVTKCGPYHYITLKLLQQNYNNKWSKEQIEQSGQAVNKQKLVFLRSLFNIQCSTANLAPNLFDECTDLEWHHNLCPMTGPSACCRSACQQCNSAIYGGVANGPGHPWHSDDLIGLHSVLKSSPYQWEMVCPY